MIRTLALAALLALCTTTLAGASGQLAPRQASDDIAVVGRCAPSEVYLSVFAPSGDDPHLYALGFCGQVRVAWAINAYDPTLRWVATEGSPQWQRVPTPLGPPACRRLAGREVC